MKPLMSAAPVQVKQEPNTELGTSMTTRTVAFASTQNTVANKIAALAPTLGPNQQIKVSSTLITSKISVLGWEING